LEGSVRRSGDRIVVTCGSHGATRDAVIEALSVAIQVNAGAALLYSARTLDALKAKVP
jgi:hypothetical protein